MACHMRGRASAASQPPTVGQLMVELQAWSAAAVVPIFWAVATKPTERPETVSGRLFEYASGHREAVSACPAALAAGGSGQPAVSHSYPPGYLT